MAKTMESSVESECNSLSKLSVLSHFFMESNKSKTEWTMKCRLCLMKIRSLPAVTSNFHRHMRTNHKENYHEKVSELKKNINFKGQTTFNFDASINPEQSVIINDDMYAHTSVRHKELMASLMNMIAESMLPPRIVDLAGFRKFVSLLDPKFEIPNHQMVTRHLKKTLQFTEPAFKEEIIQIESESDSASKSSVLSHFFEDSIKSKTKWIMKCKLCSTKIRSLPTVSSNFHRHVRRNHIEQYQVQVSEFNAKKIGIRGQTSLNFSANSNREEPVYIDNDTYAHKSVRHKELIAALMNMIAESMWPPSIVDLAGFRKFVSLLDPKFKIPNQQTVTRHLKKTLQLTEPAISEDIIPIVSENDSASKSSILSHFFEDTIKSKTEWTMKCKLCSTKIRSLPAVSSNFHRHMRTNHKENYHEKVSELKKNINFKDQTTLNFDASTTPEQPVIINDDMYAHTSVRHKELMAALMNMIAESMLPPSIVDLAGFRKFVSLLDPKFEIPNHQMVTRHLKKTLQLTEPASKEEIIQIELESDPASKSSVLSHFFEDSIKSKTEWTMKCKLCFKKIRSLPAVSSNFHRHMRTNHKDHYNSKVIELNNKKNIVKGHTTFDVSTIKEDQCPLTTVMNNLQFAPFDDSVWDVKDSFSSEAI